MRRSRGINNSNRAVAKSTAESEDKMKIDTIYKDSQRVVKAVWVNDKLLYTVTYTKDEEGFCNKMIRVYTDGTVEIQ